MNIISKLKYRKLYERERIEKRKDYIELTGTERHNVCQEYVNHPQMLPSLLRGEVVLKNVLKLLCVGTVKRSSKPKHGDITTV